jgi:hypothetical protein
VRNKPIRRKPWNVSKSPEIHDTRGLSLLIDDKLGGSHFYLDQKTKKTQEPHDARGLSLLIDEKLGGSNFYLD